MGSGGGGVDIGGGKGHGDGGNGQGIRPSGDGSYTVWGNLTVPSGVEFPGGITLNIPKDTTLNLPENFNWPENIKVKGDGTITPDNKKLPATITLKDDLIFATGKPINLNYTYNGNGQVTITWYEDENTTQELQEAPKGDRFYWIEMSAEATNLYQAVSKIEKVEVKKEGRAPEKPTISQTNAGSITVKTVSGQKYICTDSSNPPSIDDPDWIDGTGMEYKFDGLHSNKQYYIHTYFTGNDYLATSTIIYRDTTTKPADYTVAFPASLTAGGSGSIAPGATFDVGFGGQAVVTAPATVTLTDNATGKTVTAALLVNGQPHDGSGAVATFSGAGDTGVEVGVALPADVAQAGSYTGNITFTVTYTEGETTGSTTQNVGVTYTCHSVTFNAQGGSGVNPQLVADGGHATEPAAPTKTGYTFAGWYKDSALTQAWDFGADTVTADVTLYAKWTPVDYTVHVTAENGSANADKQTANLGDMVTLQADPDEGYHFVQWEVVAGSVTVSKENTFTMPAGDVTVKAVFAAHDYTAWAANNNGTHSRTCSVCGDTQNGNCSGGEATCSQLAICEFCGSQYGALAPDNHKAVSEWTKENGKHYHKCEYGCDTHLDEADCSGGEATCTALAVCDTCGEEYGKVNASNHTNLVKTEAKAATHMAEGNIEYWYCDGCEKYFSDEAGTKEIALKDTVIPKLTEHTADGTGWHSDETNHWNTCECGEKLNEAAHTFEWVIDKEATATEKGSKHEKCTVCGYEKAAVEIPATGTPSDTDTSSPQTGDDSNIALWIAVMLAAGAALTGTAVYSRKRKHSR